MTGNVNRLPKRYTVYRVVPSRHRQHPRVGRYISLSAAQLAAQAVAGRATIEDARSVYRAMSEHGILMRESRLVSGYCNVPLGHKITKPFISVDGHQYRIVHFRR